jgi:hypothetical protein
MWQPPGWSPEGAVDFLRRLVNDDAGLGAWAQDGPDERWAEWLRGQELAPYAWRRLKETGYAGRLPASCATPLRGAYYAAAGDAELHRRELTVALARLREHGVTPILFKGAALAHTAYPDPACRPMGDLDLWVTAEAMPSARAALASLGYTEHGKDDRPLAIQAQMSGEVQLVGRAAGQGLIELHWGAFAGEWLRRTAAVDHRAIFCRARAGQIAGCEAWTMAPEDALIQLAVHLAINHQMAYPGVRGLLDVALLARTETVDWLALAARAREWRVATATWLVLSLTESLLGLPGAEVAVAALAPFERKQAAIRRFVTAQSVLTGKDITGGPRRFAYQLVLVDRPHDAARLVGRTLWPERNWLRARYGTAGPGVRVRHLAGAARGRI